MANEVVGKTLKLFINSVEQPVKQVQFDRNFNMIDSTDSTTESPAMESMPSRAKSSIKIDANLLSALGTELTTGSPTAGLKYLVTGGTVETHTLGTIFTSDGTETLSSTNKVKALGSKITGKDLSVTISGSPFLCTNAEYGVTYNEIDVTTSSTPSPNTEAIVSRAKFTAKFDCIMYKSTAELIANDAPVAVPVVITFATGITVTGNAILTQMSITDEVKSACKVTYQAEFQGLPVEVGVGYLTLGTTQTFQLIFETGTTTNKQITGNVNLVSKSITVDVSNDAAVTYNGSINGTITPAVYS